MRKRTIAIAAAGGLLLFAAVAPEPRADLRILTHDAGDPSPRRVQAAVDLGLVAISILVTWTGKPFNR